MKSLREKVDLYREARLWIVQVILPIVGIGGFLLSHKNDIEDIIKKVK